MIKLVNDTINNDDIDGLIEWLKTYPKLTKGQETLKLESDFAKWLDVKYSIFVNSGSSANLLMIYSLIEMGVLGPGDPVIVPALAWATDLAPIIQLGLHPVLCDCNLDDLSIDIFHLQKLIDQYNPKILLLVSVLGLVPNMNKILDLCESNNMILLEDVCESLGSEYYNRKLGTFGLMSTFSTFFGHHISTIEGGFICTDDEDYYNLLLSLRSHGWSRDCTDTHKTYLQKQWMVNDFSSLYTFYHAGFNLRSTDLQAFIGHGQLEKLDSIIEIRNKNFHYYDEHIKNDYWKPLIYNDRKISNFAYPILHRDRAKIINELIENNIEVRPLIAGNLGSQPFYKKKYKESRLINVHDVDRYGFYLPNHPNLQIHEIEKICGIVNKYQNF